MQTRDPDAEPVSVNEEGLIVVSYYDIAKKRIQELTEDLFFDGDLDKKE